MENCDAQNELCRATKAPEEAYRIAYPTKGWINTPKFMLRREAQRRAVGEAVGYKLGWRRWNLFEEDIETIGEVDANKRKVEVRTGGMITGDRRCYNCGKPGFTREHMNEWAAKNVTVTFAGKLGKRNSRGSLIDAEKRYSTNELEMLADVMGAEYFRNYVIARKFQVVTDLKAVVLLLNRNNKKNKTMFSLLTRWLDRLIPFDFEVDHNQGRNLDYLSRHPNSEAKSVSEYDSLFTVAKNSLRAPSVTRMFWQRARQLKITVNAIFSNFQTGN